MKNCQHENLKIPKIKVQLEQNRFSVTIKKNYKKKNLEKNLKNLKKKYKRSFVRPEANSNEIKERFLHPYKKKNSRKRKKYSLSKSRNRLKTIDAIKIQPSVLLTSKRAAKFTQLTSGRDSFKTLENIQTINPLEKYYTKKRKVQSKKPSQSKSSVWESLKKGNINFKIKDFRFKLRKGLQAKLKDSFKSETKSEKNQLKSEREKEGNLSPFLSSPSETYRPLKKLEIDNSNERLPFKHRGNQLKALLEMKTQQSNRTSQSDSNFRHSEDNLEILESKLELKSQSNNEMSIFGNAAKKKSLIHLGNSFLQKNGNLSLSSPKMIQKKHLNIDKSVFTKRKLKNSAFGNNKAAKLH